MNLLLTAGRASRLGDKAPHRCKALTPLAGRPIIEWQLDVLGSATIVCRTEHADLLRQYGPVVTDDEARGPGHSLGVGLRAVDDDPVLVVYADTFFDRIPEGSDWVGVGLGHAGRSWDRVWPGGAVHYEFCTEPVVACVGLYAFSDTRWVRRKVDSLSGYFHSKKEWGMPPVLNAYRNHRYEPIPGWQDIGDIPSLTQWRATA